MALISLYSWSVDYTLPAAVGGCRWWTFVRVLSKLFLLKERRERIISHLLNIRFVHNAAGVFVTRALLPLLIAAMVAVAELRALFSFRVTFSFKMFDVAAVVQILAVFILLLFFCFSVSVCCFSRRWAKRERLNILFDGLEHERFWIIHSRLLMWLSAAGVSCAPDAGFLLVTESPQTLEFFS